MIDQSKPRGHFVVLAISWLTLTILMGLLLTIPVNIVSAGFAGPSAITIDGTFTDWGTTTMPTSGVIVFKDYNGNPGDGSGYTGTEADINNFRMAVSTLNGGSAVASTSNPIQNVYYRIDSLSGTSFRSQCYNIHLNLGSAASGYCDHLLQIFADSTASPQVKIVLSTYTTPYPAMRAFTAGSFIPVVSNIASGYGVFDDGASGALNKYDGTNYAVEAAIPIRWFGTAYGGAISMDGSGLNGGVVGACFTSTGSLGSVGPVKDTMGSDATTANMFMTFFASGESSFPTAAIAQLVMATGSQSIAVGEASSLITVQTQMATGEAMAVTANTLVQLTSSSSTGRFDISSTGLFALTSVTIPTSGNSVNFYYKDTTAGTFTIYGKESPEVGWINATQQIVVRSGELDHFSVSGTPSVSMAGQSFAGNVIVTAYDSYGNVKTDYTGLVYFTSTDSYPATLPYTVSGKYTFTSEDNGVHTFDGTSFRLFSASTQTITVTDGSVSRTSDQITVSAAALDHILVSPEASSIVVGGSQAFMVEAFDQFGNSRGMVTGSSTFSIDSVTGYTWTGNSVQVTRAGDWTVSCRFGGKSGTVGLAVQHAAASDLIIDSISGSIIAGGSKMFTATAKDVYGNEWNVNDLTTWRIDAAADGEWHLNSCTATKQGTWNVIGACGPLSGTNYLIVNHAASAFVNITPSHVKITADESQSFTAQATDIYGNAWDATSQVSWAINSDAGGSWEGTTYHAGKCGNWTVTCNLPAPSMLLQGGYGKGLLASSSPVSATAVLQVDHGMQTGLVIGPSYAITTAGQNVLFYGLASDAKGNVWNATSSTIWSVNDEANGTWDLNLYRAETAGNWTITAKLGSSAASVQLFVTHDSPVSIKVVSDAKSIRAGGSEAFFAFASDAYGNLWNVTPSSVWAVEEAAEGVWDNDKYTAHTTGDWNVTASYDRFEINVIIRVIPGDLDHFDIDLPNAIQSNKSFYVTVTAYDACGNIKTDYYGTVHFSTSASSLNLIQPSDYNFVTKDNGSHVFSFISSGADQGSLELFVNDGAVLAQKPLTVLALSNNDGTNLDLLFPLIFLLAPLLFLMMMLRKRVVIDSDRSVIDAGGSICSFTVQVKNGFGGAAVMREDTHIQLSSDVHSSSFRTSLEGPSFSERIDLVIRKGECSTTVLMNDAARGKPTITARKGRGYLWRPGNLELMVEDRR